MKRLFLLTYLVALAFVANAQYEAQLLTATSDTAADGETVYATITPPLNHDWVYSAQVNFDETVAGADGTITWEASIDGDDYIDISSDGDAGDTASGVDADGLADTYTDVTGTPYKYFRAKYVEDGGGSGEGLIKVYMWLIPKDGFIPEKYEMTGSTDTITDSDNESVDIAGPLNYGFQYAIQADVDELSGAATIALKVQGSNDNSNWDDMQSETSITEDGTYILSDTDYTPYKYLRLNVSQTGTATSRTYITAILKPKYD